MSADTPATSATAETEVERQDEPGADEARPAADSVVADEEIEATASTAAVPELGADTDVQVDPANLEAGADPVASSDPAEKVDSPDELGGTAGDNAGGAG